MSGHRRSAPPTAWLLAFVTILPMPLPLLVPGEFAQHKILAANEELYRRELGEFLGAPRHDDSEMRGVMLAMSGGGCAAIGPRRLADDGVDLYMVVYNEATVMQFRGLVDDIVSGRPEFVVIQDTVLIQTKPGDPIRDRYREARSYWRSLVRRGFAAQNGNRNGDAGGVGNWQCTGWPEARSQWAGKVRSRTDRLLAHPLKQHEAIAEFVGSFSDAGIPVMVVSPPANSYSSDYTSRVHDAARTLLSGEPPITGVSLHRQASLMPDELFPDPFHLSPEKNQPYRDWLNEEIIRVLGERADR